MARYIDADKLKEKLEIISVVADDLYGMGINRGLDRAETEIDMFPTADVVEVRHGEWEAKFHNSVSGRGRNRHYATFKCSECQKWNGTHRQNYCPSCGAKMDGGKNE